MPSTRKAAAAASAASASTPPATSPLEGCTLAFFGRFDIRDKTLSHSKLETRTKALGGNVSKSVTNNTTHLIYTWDDYDDMNIKVSNAKNKQVPIVEVEWFLECESQNKRVNESKWLHISSPPLPLTFNRDASEDEAAPKAKATNGKATTTTLSTGRKRTASAKADKTEDEPEPKKTKSGAKARGAKAKVKAEEDGEEEVEEETKQDVEEPKAEKHVAEGQFLKKKGSNVPVDEYFNLPNYQVYVDDDGMIWDASLNQSNSGKNNNKFYRIQVLQSQTSDFKTWTRWGRVGEGGQNALLGTGSLSDAIKNFEKKFKDKSGLTWADRGDNPKPNKYAFVERNYNSDSDDDEEDEKPQVKKEEDNEIEPELSCTLQKPVQDLMALIFNQAYFQAAMSDLNYDANKMPLGKLSKATIIRGFQQLKDLAALMNDSALASSQWDMSVADATEHLSNTYYSVIPHAFGRNRPPIIQSEALLKREIELLESLSDMKDAAEIMKIDKKTKDTIHAMDRQFQGLNLNEMSVLDQKSTEFSLLARYLNDSRGATHHMNYKVQQIFRIERQGEKERFDKSPYAKIKSNRRLLWHGSRCTNFGGILSQGLRIAPPEAPVSGYMFGKGIYLADTSSKSASYCASGLSNGNALLLLCEAELGDPMQELVNSSYSAGEDAKKNGMYSTWGQGNTGPSKWMDAEAVHPSLKGIKMPDLDTPPGPTNINMSSLCYNEYICYNIAQVKLRYLLRVTI